MPTALSLAPLTLAAVLTLSGIAKLGDPQSTASMIRLLRLPSLLHNRVVPRALPVVELVTAALLVTPWRWTYAVGAALALGLFTAFLVIMARALTFSPRPTCSCFGRVGDHRVTGRTVLRNSLLVALALVAGWIAVAGASAGWLVAGYDRNDWLWLVLAVALAAVAVLILGRGGSSPARHGGAKAAARAQSEGGQAGRQDYPGSAGGAGDAATDDLDYERAPIPRAVLLSPDLEVSSLRRLVRERAQLLVLVNCWCGPTFVAVERLPEWRERLPQLGVQLVHTMRPWDEPQIAALSGVWWDPGSTTFDALRSGTSPAAVLLGADGLLAGGPVNGIEAIEQFVDDIEAELAGADAVESEDDQTVS